MTLEACMAFCSDYTYFGVEYAQECYCGNSFNVGSIPAPATDCSLVCTGDKYEYCGNGNRLSVYAKNRTAIPSGTTTCETDPPAPCPNLSMNRLLTYVTLLASASAPTSTVPVPTGMPDGWSYQGCWVDGAQGRILSFQAPDSQTNTQESCAQLCASSGYTVSGTEYAVQCFCGNFIQNGGVKSLDADCSTTCSGNANEKCGAGGRLTIFSKGTPQVYAGPEPQTGGLNGSWTYQGCVEDNINQKRTFFWQLFFPGVMTANMCLSKCAEFGYAAAGLEYGEECYCGDPANVAAMGATFRPEAECNIPCAGNASAICGGGSRLTTYFWTGEPMYSWDFPQDYRAGKYDMLIDGVTIPLMTMQSVTGKVQFISKWGTGPANETGAYELDLSVIGNSALAWRPPPPEDRCLLLRWCHPS